MAEDLTHEDRRIVTVALLRLRDDLRKEAKKLQGFGKELMATDLNIEAGRITDHILPLYDDQTTLSLGSEDDEEEDAEDTEPAGTAS